SGTCCRPSRTSPSGFTRLSRTAPGRRTVGGWRCRGHRSSAVEEERQLAERTESEQRDEPAAAEAFEGIAEAERPARRGREHVRRLQVVAVARRVGDREVE